MNKPVLVLAATTVAGAAAALYFRQQLIEERARTAAVIQAAPAPVAAPVAVPVNASPAAEPPVPSPAAARIDSPPKPAGTPPPRLVFSDTGSPVVVSDDRKARSRKQAAEFLARYDDPSRRGELHAQALERTRKAFEEFAKKRNLDADQFEKLVAVLADQELERRAVQARCLASPDCDKPDDAYRELLARHKQTLVDVVGEDGFRELSEWGASQTDRRMADAIGKRLPESVAWSPDHSAALASALKDGRSAAMREMFAQHQHFRGFGNQEGMSVMYADELPTLEARLASADAYAQRMRTHAATVLSGEQLRVFDQMQAELLSDLARFLRRRDAE